MSIDSRDPIISSLSGVPSYQEPEQEPDSRYMRALSLAAQDQVWSRSPWRPYVTKTLLPADMTRYHESRGGAPSATDPSTVLAGPSVQLGSYFLPRDHTNPTPPADAVWDSNPATLQPAELIVKTTVSTERLSDSREFQRLEAGVPLRDEITGRADPSLVAALADAVMRGEDDAFAVGPGTNASPILGLSGIAGFTSTAATTTPYVDDFLGALAALKALRRSPNACFIPTGLFKLWRTAKGTGGGSYLFPPNQPLFLDDVPVIPLGSLANGASVPGYIGDFRSIVAMWRLLPPYGLLLSAARVMLGVTDFRDDRWTYRLIERFDLKLIPNQGPAITKITAINSPAP
jgi:capsid protein